MPKRGTTLGDFLAAPPAPFSGLLSHSAAGGLLGGDFPAPVAAAPINMVPLAGGMVRKGMGGRTIKNLKGEQIEAPRVFYRGTNPGDERRIRTGAKEWDSYLFAASNESDARLYGSEIQTLRAAPDAKILYEGTAEWNKVAGKWRKDENMLQYADRAAKAARAAGYDAAWFKRQGDIGTTIFNPSKFR